jgi:hypothetical protein
MRRVTVVGVAVALVLAGWFALGRLSDATGAQQGTPPGGASEPSEGLAFALLGVGTADELPAPPADLALFRLMLEPGVVLPLDPADPSASLLYVESGTLSLRVDAPLTVRRASTAATPVAGAGDEGEPAREPVAAGTEVTLGPGDSVVISPRSAGEARNGGTEPLVLLISEVAPRQDAATPAS